LDFKIAGGSMRRVIAFSVLILLLIAAVVVARGQRAEEPSRENEPAQSPSGEQWEYLVVAGGHVNLSSSGSATMRKEPAISAFRENYPLQQNLDKLGAKGWELLHVAGNPSDPVYYFKRKK
jgi:hypothetical protein